MVACSTPQMLRGPLACVLEADWLRDLDWAGLPDRNLAGLLFRLEHSTAIEQIPDHVDQ
ncbi:hypothetical protein [Parapusillimonas granuli]|uniref:Uncharacterized protein n=1 Tax=Parapusillimonas granuli TaxID=380911 RepID=A0A853G554_9BURK|nr:hypothetical protein [Parapusillimonas granuli]MBB5217286.1 hypothetical protein [Parapusillimonas granuli]MEB2399299.1 hypothetical protein [Alcaligenaceae bacterium]NYT50922.1 hypothetical protein [Parapusillimonas granuli]